MQRLREFISGYRAPRCLLAGNTINFGQTPAGVSEAPVSPLSAIDDITLWNTQLQLAILCNRQKYSLKQHRVAELCELGRALKVEADLRGVPSPKHPYHIGDVL